MIKNNPIIKSTLVIYLTTYLFVAIWSFLDRQIRMDELINSLCTALLIIMSVICLGFVWTLGLIWLRKTSLLSDLNKKRSNGRYSTTQGDLPAIDQHKFTTTVSTKKTLTPNLLVWVTEESDISSVYINLFLKCAGILHRNRKALAELNEPSSLYTHSKKIAEEIIKLQKIGDNELLTQFEQCSNFKNYNLQINDLKIALHSPLIVILGMCHDIGKLDSPIEPNQSAYLPDYGIRGRNLLAKLNETWLLPKNDSSDLFIVMANYNNYDAAPKLLQNGRLICKSMNATCLTVILLYCHELGVRNNEINDAEEVNDVHIDEEVEQFSPLTTVFNDTQSYVNSNTTQRFQLVEDVVECFEATIPISEVKFESVEVPTINLNINEQPEESEETVRDLFINHSIEPSTSELKMTSHKINQAPQSQDDAQTVKGFFTSNGNHKSARPNLRTTYNKSKTRYKNSKPYSINNLSNHKSIEVSDE